MSARQGQLEEQLGKLCETWRHQAALISDAAIDASVEDDELRETRLSAEAETLFDCAAELQAILDADTPLP